MLKKVKNIILIAFLVFAGYGMYQFYAKYVLENKILKQIVSRLEADSRIAEVLVTDFQEDPGGKPGVTVKFLEYNSAGEPLAPKYFTFKGNLIQFQSLVVRFDDIYVEQGDALRGKSAYLFWKIFVLDGKDTQEFILTPVNQVPAGYKLEGEHNAIETEFWRNFWSYALDPGIARKEGIKNAQIEAPGTKFIPGRLYTLKIEHDGGIRIDVSEIPTVLKGEKIE